MNPRKDVLNFQVLCLLLLKSWIERETYFSSPRKWGLIKNVSAWFNSNTIWLRRRLSNAKNHLIDCGLHTQSQWDKYLYQKINCTPPGRVAGSFANYFC
jgi:hypothetical protein